MDLGGHTTNLEYLTKTLPHAKTLRWRTHLNCMQKAAGLSRTRFFWLISTCCDYENFDFLWEPVPWQATQIHCWASGNQKFGDTFLVPTREFIEQDPATIDGYHHINWQQIGVPRLPPQLIIYSDQDLISASKQRITTPYAYVTDKCIPEYYPQLWNNPPIVAVNKSRSVSIVPRSASAYIDTQIYDYQNLVTEILIDSPPMDVIYISNGEPDSEKWYDHLCDILPNGTVCKRSMNINGRANAYKAAANLSTTPWFFAVFAKLEVVDNFDWSWQPDYWQSNRHYIFYSKNPVNGLQYGHQGIICYNRRLVLDTDNYGLDFTLSKPHAVVPVLSAIAHYNTTPELTWRTAFREVLKLKDDVIKTGSIESGYRLDVWLTKAEGQFAEWSICGANEAIKYYHKVNGDYAQLMLSFEWEFLHNYHDELYQC